MDINGLYQSMLGDDIHFFDFKTKDIADSKAASIELNGLFAVFIDTSQIVSRAEELCIVAHEYGHCATGALHKVDSDLDIISKHEYKADKYAVHKILPVEELKEAIAAGCAESWEFNEYFDEAYTEDFIKRAVYIYQCEGLL